MRYEKYSTNTKVAFHLHIHGVSANGCATKIQVGEREMNDLILKLSAKIQNAMSSEEGQDLIEYALVVALIALAATAGMGTVATAINTAFTNVGNRSEERRVGKE